MGERPMIGDKLFGAPVVAIGMKAGERWAMTIDKHGTVALWPEGTWPEPEQGGDGGTID